MKSKKLLHRFQRITAAICALALLLCLSPSARAAESDGGSKIMTDPGSTFSDHYVIMADGSLRVSAVDETWLEALPRSGIRALYPEFILQEDGTAWWRDNAEGNRPAVTKGPDSIKQTSVLWQALLRKDGTVLWYNGDDYPEVGIYDVKQVAGRIILKNDGSVWSWDYDDKTESATNLTKIMDGVAYVEDYMLIKTDGSLWTWGDNKCGQVGNGSSEEFVEKPVKIMDHVIGVWNYYNNARFALTEDGTLYGWGYYGRDSAQYQDTPLKIDIDNVVFVGRLRRLEGGMLLTMLKQDGSLWTYNEDTQSFSKALDGVKIPEGAPVPAGSTSVPSSSTAKQTFSDVPAGSWYAPYVEAAYQAGLINGVGDNRFHPDGALTVAEVVTLGARIYAKNHGETAPSGGDPWYQNALKYFVENGKNNIVPLTTAMMTQAATRYETVVLLNGVVPRERFDNSVTVEDGSIKGFRDDDIYQMIVYDWYRAGIVGGDEDGNFNPNQDITRAEMAKILCMIYRLV